EKLGRDLAARASEAERHRAQSAELRERVHSLRAAANAASREAQGYEMKEHDQRLHLDLLETKVREELLLEPDELARQVAAIEAGEAALLVLPNPLPPPQPELATTPDGAPATDAAAGDSKATPAAAATTTPPAPVEAALPAAPPAPPPPSELKL